MQGTIQNYTLDMADDRKKEPLRVKQGDTNSRWARISLTAFGAPWSIPAGKGYISVKKVDGTAVLNDCTVEGENHKSPRCRVSSRQSCTFWPWTVISSPRPSRYRCCRPLWING